jgi:uncharacterized protein (DUF849 family)
MARPIIVTAAVTGGSVAALREHPAIPRSPAEICAACVASAEAGAAIVHVHVRDPETGLPSNRFELYAELMERLRASGIDALVNVTTSMDGHLVLQKGEAVALSPRSTLGTPEARLRHVLTLRPEIATLDCGVMAHGEAIFVARHSDLTAMAKLMRDAGLKPEIECFEPGHVENARRLIAEGAFAGPPFLQICLGTGYGAPTDLGLLRAMHGILPDGVVWAAFGCGPGQLDILDETIRLGGHLRVGLEDNRLNAAGAQADNGALVREAVSRIGAAGHRAATPAEARAILGIGAAA